MLQFCFFQEHYRSTHIPGGGRKIFQPLRYHKHRPHCPSKAHAIPIRLSFLRNSITPCRSLALNEGILDVAAKAIAWLDLIGTPTARH
ncbi:MAG TPA: hypothetical protein PLV19_03500 [Nitrosomonas sp.]|nr:hypothetical protein [Nitrosomonas sp.]HRB21011.1 hypothetical protein [Nitrosomonas sp.]HRB32058.1 hypothetical protein [Nitrosomonas sp.]HRB45492.1 hypothetical protein [Nitrosomonas sp.]HRB76992.1 hypothetical protein [Nitrosomonas sp.]